MALYDSLIVVPCVLRSKNLRGSRTVGFDLVSKTVLNVILCDQFLNSPIGPNDFRVQLRSVAHGNVLVVRYRSVLRAACHVDIDCIDCTRNSSGDNNLRPFEQVLERVLRDVLSAVGRLVKDIN